MDEEVKHYIYKIIYNQNKKQLDVLLNKNKKKYIYLINIEALKIPLNLKKKVSIMYLIH